MGSSELDLKQAQGRAAASLRTPERVVLTAGLVAAGYTVGMLAGAVQPLLPGGIPSFWLANAFLTGVLLMTARREWWAYTLAALTVHLLVMVVLRSPPILVSAEVLANLAQPLASAWVVRRYVAPSGWFGQLGSASWFIGLAGLVIPAAIGLAATGATLWLGAGDDFWQLWRLRYRPNSVAALTLTPSLVLIWEQMRMRSAGAESVPLLKHRGLEAGLLSAALTLVGALLLLPTPILPQYEFVLVYLPIPLFLWAAVRFGSGSLCMAVLVLGSLLVWAAERGAGVFSTGVLLVDGVDIDLFLIVSAIPLILLAVAFEEKRQVVDEVYRSEENFRRLAESTAAIPWEADAEHWHFNYVGPQAGRLLGLPASRWLEDGFFGLRLHHDDRERVLGEFAGAVETGRSLELQYRMTDADDDVVWVNDFVRCERLPTGRTLLRGFMIDVTERMRSVHEIQAMRERMTQASRISTVGELTASISHDLYQPLTAILHNAEVAEELLSQEHPDVPELRRILADILDDDRRAREILQRMRKLMQTGKIAEEPLDLRALVAATLDLVATEAAVRDVRVELVAEPDEAVVRGDVIHLQQLVLNLLLNAFDAVSVRSGVDRAVTVRLERQDRSHVLLSVTDTGPGIADSVRQRLFEPFQSTKPDGLGIGLSIARRIAEAHGGEIWAEEGDVGGARLRVRLPLV